MAKIWTAGEIIVEIMRVKEDKPLDEEHTFRGPFPSGAPAIFISAAAQLGAQAKIWGGVGRDKFGDLLLRRLKADGVDVSDIQIAGEGATGTAFVAYQANGDREFIFHIDGTPSANIDFKENGQIPDFFHVMGCSLTVNSKMRSEIEHAVQYFAQNKAKISFDPNIRPSLLAGRSIMEIAGVVMEHCSVFLPGSDELMLFAGGADSTAGAAEALFQRFPKLEIIHVKKGKRGSQIITRSATVDIPIYQIEKTYPIVDPTGSGDSFDAAFVTALAGGLELEKAGALAAKAGAINAAALGPMGGKIKELINKALAGEAQ
ncbi:MAG: sugar kinase [Spirochaetaceae bacterium]|jgi:sugar/nucleoside kinase (ribokinase family)|nr:sugar kinase [Spirochaetaceae bacterium]